MKKLHQFVISRASRALKTGKMDSQRFIDAKITRALHDWADRGGFLEHGCNLDSLSKELDVSKAQLQYYFSSVVGVRFSFWLKALRVEKAKKVMAAYPDMPISLVGEKVGYPDKSNFKKRFAEVEGCSPVEWKKINLI